MKRLSLVSGFYIPHKKSPGNLKLLVGQAPKMLIMSLVTGFCIPNKKKSRGFKTSCQVDSNNVNYITCDSVLHSNNRPNNLKFLVSF